MATSISLDGLLRRSTKARQTFRSGVFSLTFRCFETIFPSPKFSRIKGTSYIESAVCSGITALRWTLQNNDIFSRNASGTA